MVVVHRRNRREGQSGGEGIYIGISQRDKGEGGGLVGIGRRGLFRNITETGGNTWKEWVKVRQMTNGICLCLPLKRVCK